MPTSWLPLAVLTTRCALAHPGAGAPTPPGAVLPSTPPAGAAGSKDFETAQRDAYLRALEAWGKGEASAALDLARQAQAMGPTHDGARLLQGYALLRLGRVNEALPVLARLATDPVADDNARRMGERAWRQRSDRRLRSSVSAMVGAQFWTRPYGGGANPAVGYALALNLPIADLLSFRIDTALNRSFDDPLLSGPTGSALFTAQIPLASGDWHWGFGAGPAGWFLSGPLAPDGEARVEIGLHSAAWIDVRAWRRAGFAFELGGFSWPQAAPELSAYMFSWDARLSLVAWFGPGRRRPISLRP